MNISACVWEILLPDKGVLYRPKIHRVGQIEGRNKFAIRFHELCLNHDAEWELEQMPSSRDDAFMERCRFKTFAEAVKTFKKTLN
ncbi:MAG: hypothetical protein HQ580_19245 [Planctomycetes bacterium]|nr:hypothetical protein [Planctomycetota bacterium]